MGVTQNLLRVFQWCTNIFVERGLHVAAYMRRNAPHASLFYEHIQRAIEIAWRNWRANPVNTARAV